MHTYTPPRNLTQLRKLIVAMGTKSSPIKLGKRSLAAITELINMPEIVAFSTISQLADTLAVSPSTLTRIATRIGYSGFNQFQDVFRLHLSSQPHFYSARASLLATTENQASSHQILQKIASEEIANIQTMIAQVSDVDLTTAIDLLTTSNNVRTFAQRQFYSLATFFSYCLGLLRSQVSVLGESGHGIPHALAQLNEQDLLVVFGSNPYSRLAVDCCINAKTMGIPTLVFSDAHGAPLNDGASVLFTVPVEGSFFSNSSAAWVVLIEAILSVYARQIGPDAVAALEQREQIFDQMNVTFN